MSTFRINQVERERMASSKILQIIPATGWVAVFHAADALAVDYMSVACFALGQEPLSFGPKEQKIVGMVCVNEEGLVNAEMRPGFLRYEYLPAP